MAHFKCFTNFLRCFFLLNCGFLLGALNVKSQNHSISSDQQRSDSKWTHRRQLNEDVCILWTMTGEDITFEIQARTKGYVGLGFSFDGRQEGTDIAIGWVHQGYTFFQDRYVPKNGSEPLIDPSQDYVLLMGYENATHTVIRFRRKLNTCDSLHDIPITNDTMRLMYMYDNEDPQVDLISSGTLPHIEAAWRPYQSIILAKEIRGKLNQSEETVALEWRNTNAELPFGADTVIWCKMFKLDNSHGRRHMIRYKPVFDSSWSIFYLHQITLYQCEGDFSEEAAIFKLGSKCLGVSNTGLPCTSHVASWTRGSEEFVFPAEVGYPLDAKEGQYFMMETHYYNIKSDNEDPRFNAITDNSGLKLYVTEHLRPHEAGILSIGIEPNWHHIIPPMQKYVVSKGHCLEECTAFAFPMAGIRVFAALMRTHQIGKSIKIRHIRKNTELPPIANDDNVDPDYQILREVPHQNPIMPGDRLITECIYDSSSRNAITLGGITMKEEACSSLMFYYPRQRKLSSCQSIPNLATVLHSLGINYLKPNSSPVVISSPAELEGMTLEDRLLSYDWKNQFKHFQDTTAKGSFMPYCRGFNNSLLPLFKKLVGHPINVTAIDRKVDRCKWKSRDLDKDFRLKVLKQPDYRRNDIIHSVVRNGRSSEINTLALSDLRIKSAGYVVNISTSVFSLIFFVTVIIR